MSEGWEGISVYVGIYVSIERYILFYLIEKFDSMENVILYTVKLLLEWN